jgi:hypothetical protein
MAGIAVTRVPAEFVHAPEPIPASDNPARVAGHGVGCGPELATGGW